MNGLLPPVRVLQVDVEGFVWAEKCTCPRHVPGPGQKAHDAKPLGNVIADPTLCERLGIRPRSQSEVA